MDGHELVRILLADDHVVFREGLKLILLQDIQPAVVGEAGAASQVFLRLRQQDWRLLILDLALPDRNGLEILPEIRRIAPQLRILILSMYPESEFALKALRAGADGYLAKDASRAELLTAIRTVLEGRKYIGTESLARALEGRDARPLHARLSRREFEVLRAIVHGRPLTQIGADLYLSPHTISTYRTRILQKMGMKSNAELVQYAVQHNLF